MKKLITFLLTLVLVFALVGCAEQDDFDEYEYDGDERIEVQDDDREYDYEDDEDDEYEDD